MKALAYFSCATLLSVFLACSSSTTTTERTLFSRADSVQDSYLTLQDTLHYAWNLIIKDENEKIHHLHTLLHHLIEDNVHDPATLNSLDDRLRQLRRLKITQKTLANGYVVEEYDFASTSLISEVLSITETHPELLSNRTVQNLVDRLKMTDLRIEENRAHYDSVAELFNAFIESNKTTLKEIDRKLNLEKRPQFKAASPKDQN